MADIPLRPNLQPLRYRRPALRWITSADQDQLGVLRPRLRAAAINLRDRQRGPQLTVSLATLGTTTMTGTLVARIKRSLS